MCEDDLINFYFLIQTSSLDADAVASITTNNFPTYAMTLQIESFDVSWPVSIKVNEKLVLYSYNTLGPLPPLYSSNWLCECFWLLDKRSGPATSRPASSIHPRTLLSIYSNMGFVKYCYFFFQKKGEKKCIKNIMNETQKNYFLKIGTFETWIPNTVKQCFFGIAESPREEEPPTWFPIRLKFPWSRTREREEEGGRGENHAAAAPLALVRPRRTSLRVTWPFQDFAQDVLSH